jgi:4-aminobutyrate aminotransferase-like enzyme
VRDAAVFLHQSLSTPCLNVLKSCQGSFLKDFQGSFIPLSPPLTITRQELDQALDILESALTDVEKSQ